MRIFKEVFRSLKAKLYNNDEQTALLKESINYLSKKENIPEPLNGQQNLIIVIEELGELQQVLTKQIRGMRSEDNRLDLLEEYADVVLGLEYVKLIFDLTDEEIEKAKAIKLNRIENRLKDGSFK